jgi:Ca2+-binding RTX toxin-like protein
VLIAVALSDEHKAGATTADGIAIAQASVQQESAWFSGSGDDMLDGGAGNDLLVGGDGFDTVVYSGNRAQYHFTIGDDNAIHVLDTANGDVDTLSGIEAAKFKDGTIDITVLQGDPAKLERVGLVFEAVLQRPADMAGLKSWASLDMSGTQLAQAVSATAEYQARYAGMSDAAFVQALYANSSLGAGAAGGMQSWQDFLGHHSRAELIAAWIGQDDVVHAQFGTHGLWLL